MKMIKDEVAAIPDTLSILYLMFTLKSKDDIDIVPMESDRTCVSLCNKIIGFHCYSLLSRPIDNRKKKSDNKSLS